VPKGRPAAAREHGARSGAASRGTAGDGGTAVGSLRLHRLLGEGGLCRVWLAETPAGARVALKTLRPAWAGRPEAARLLRREWTLLERIRHPNVVSVIALTEHQGAPALVMEYLGGGDLVSLVGAHPRHWIGAVREVGCALRRLQQAGLAHRDVKAGNVLFGEDGRARLIDFGSAAEIGARAVEGGVTAAHRAPATSDARVSGAEDTYALAVLVYQLMSGRLPYGPRPAPGAAGPPRAPLAEAWSDEPPLAALAEAVGAALVPSGEQARRRHTAPTGRLTAFLDVIESVAAAYPRH
jgi:eukaryotic-like serine/threonine-protein kinase